MKTELDMVRSTSPLIERNPLALLPVRKQLNEAALALTHEALMKNDPAALRRRLAELMIVVARTLVGLKLEPNLDNFVIACAELVNTTRKTMDDALRFNDDDDIRLAAVMMEVVLKGIAASLALPLEDLMRSELEKS